MDESIAKLTLILESEEDLYRRLRELLHTEREVLARLDADELSQIARRKEELSDEGRLLEQARIVVASELANSLGIEEARPRLATICEHLGAAGAEASGLRSAHNRLVVMIGVARELLEENAALARDSLAQVHGTINLLGGLVPREPCYEATGLQGSAPRAAAGQIIRQAV